MRISNPLSVIFFKWITHGSLPFLPRDPATTIGLIKVSEKLILIKLLSISTSPSSIWNSGVSVPVLIVVVALELAPKSSVTVRVAVKDPGLCIYGCM